MKVTVLYGTPKGSPDYMEEIISENEANFDKAKQWAIVNEYDRFRVAVIDLATPPDFTKTIQL